MDIDNKTNHAAAEGLGIYGPEGLAILLQARTGMIVPEWVESASTDGVATAAEAGVPGALSTLIDFSGSKYSIDTRKPAIQALARHQEPEAQEAFRRALHDKDWSIRRIAVSAIQYGDPHAVELLQDLVHDPEAAVQESAGAALFQVDTPASCTLLDQAVAEKNYPVVAGAYQRFVPPRNPNELSVLVTAIKQNGNEPMADALLNNPEKQISVAAHEWANEHGYTIIPHFQ